VNSVDKELTLEELEQVVGGGIGTDCECDPAIAVCVD
jgi:bacteriocin-like protein